MSGRGIRGGITEAVRWTAAAGAAPIGDLAGGPTYSEPTAINADASVIVGDGNTVSGQEPFRWTQASGMMGLGTLPSQVVQTVARATSADGTVVVGSGLSDTGNAIFRWTVSGGMQGIAYIFSNLPLGGPMSYFAVWSPPLLVGSDRAVVAGTAAQPSNPMVPFAFRWTPSGGLEPLADALAGVDLGGMTLGDPIAISADGSTLVGHATCAGTAAIFRASLPR